MGDDKQYRKGFGNKAAVRQKLSDDFHHSDVVRRIKTNDFRLDLGDLSLHMAREMGFCYGVERTVQYAYETLMRFPERPTNTADLSARPPSAVASSSRLRS